MLNIIFFIVCCYLLVIWLPSIIQIGSPTALADAALEGILKTAASHHGLYVPSGALWGGEDIRRMANKGTLQVHIVCIFIT